MRNGEQNQVASDRRRGPTNSAAPRGTSGRGTTGVKGSPTPRETSGQGTAGEPAGGSAPHGTPSWPTPQKNSEASAPREIADSTPVQRKAGGSSAAAPHRTGPASPPQEAAPRRSRPGNPPQQNPRKAAARTDPYDTTAGTSRTGPPGPSETTAGGSPGPGAAGGVGGVSGGGGVAESDAERRRRRAQFLRDLAEARELRDRVQPRRAKTARLRHAMRMRTFRW
jgi:hypothetical protein